jgi:hypothetical protein
VCPTKAVHFADSSREAEIFLTTIADLSSTAEDKDRYVKAFPDHANADKADTIVPVLSTTSKVKNKKLFLDTQSGIHLISYRFY